MVERLGALPERMAEDRRILLSHYRVAHVIACRANRLGGWGWVVMATVAERTGIGVKRDAEGKIVSIDTRDVRRLVKDLLLWGYFERRDAQSSTAPTNAKEFRVLYEAREGSTDPGVTLGSPTPPPPGSTDPARGPSTPGSTDPGSPPENEGHPGSTDPGVSIQHGVHGPLQVVTTSPLSSLTREGRELETRVRQAIPAEYHGALGSYLGKTKHPDEVVRELWWKALNPTVTPHFDGAIVGQALREMLIEGRPFRAGTLVRWCSNLAADAASPLALGRRREGGRAGIAQGLESIAKGGNA